MSSDRYTFQLGDFQCKVISDRVYQGPMDMGKMFPKVDPDELSAGLEKYGVDQENVTFCYNCLLVETSNNRVLIDTGIGTANEGRLLEHLKSEGVSPDSMDHIIITHCHPDHIGGITDEDGALIFSNAEYWISKAEWDYWFDAGVEEKETPQGLEFVKKNLPPLADRIHRIEDETDLFEGFSILHIPGHSAGMIAVMIESNGEKLLAGADVFHRPFQVEHTDWNIGFDRLTDLAPVARKKVLQCAVSENALVLAYHFPHPGLGHVKPHGDIWKWEPLSA